MNTIIRSTRIAFLGFTLIAAGCGGGGGGGGGGNSSPPPVLQPGSLQFLAGSLAVDENAGTASVTITRTSGSSGAVSVSITSSDGSASAAQDYSAVSTTVSFADGDAVAKTISVSIADDAVGESDETLTLDLVAPTGGATLGATRAATLTIRDNDPPAAPVVALIAAIKQLSFSWPSVPGAASLRLMLDPDGVAGAAPFAQVGADLGAGATGTTLDISVHRHDWANELYRVDACNAHGCSGSTTVRAATAMLQSIGYFKASNTGESDFFSLAIALSADGNTLAVGARNEASNATTINGNQLDDSALGAGAVYVFSRNGSQWSQQAYVKAFNAERVDFFGSALALSADGNTLAVGAPGEDSSATGVDGDAFDNSAPVAGAAYVFTRSAGQWSQQAYVKASNAEESDEFGRAIALSGDGNTLVVGAPAEDSRAKGINGDETNNLATISGAAYVFTRGPTQQWSQQAYVKASNTDRSDRFGVTLALNGDGSTLAVGAYGESSAATGIGGDQSDNSATSAGAVYVFSRDPAQVWSQQAYVKASNSQESDAFGFALSFSSDGNTLAVGSLGEDSSATGVDGDQADNGADFSGAVYVFARSATTWSQQAYVKASNTAADDSFGVALALSPDGDTLAVGAPGEESRATGIGGDQADNGASRAGAAYVFKRTAGLWSQQAYVKATNTEAFDELGHSIALSNDGETLAAGASFEASMATGVGGDQSDNSGDFAGAVYLY